MNKEKIVLIIITTVMVILVGLDIFLVEDRKIEAHRQEELAAIMEKEMLEKIKSQESREIAEFDWEYGKSKDEFIEESGDISEKINSQVLNIGELEELTMQRMDASGKLEDELNLMDIPSPLEDFYKFEIKFLENDIEAMTLILEYYNSSNYSVYDARRLDEALRESSYWFSAAEEEMERVYKEYGLEYLLES